MLVFKQLFTFLKVSCSIKRIGKETRAIMVALLQIKLRDLIKEGSDFANFNREFLD